MSAAETVTAGQPLFRVEIPALRHQLVSIEQESERLSIRRRHQQYLRQVDVAEREPSLHDVFTNVDAAALRDLQELEQSTKRRLQQLTIAAPCAGQFIACRNNSATNLDASDAAHDARPAHWTEPEQLGRTLASGTALGFICDDGRQVVSPATADQCGQMSIGAAAKLRLACANGVVLSGQISRLVPRQEVRSVCDSTMENWPAECDFAAIIEVDADGVATANRALPVGGRVEVVVTLTAESLAKTISNWLQVHVSLLSD